MRMTLCRGGGDREAPRVPPLKARCPKAVSGGVDVLADGVAGNEGGTGLMGEDREELLRLRGLVSCCPVVLLDAVHRALDHPSPQALALPVVGNGDLGDVAAAAWRADVPGEQGGIPAGSVAHAQDLQVGGVDDGVVQPELLADWVPAKYPVPLSLG